MADWENIPRLDPALQDEIDNVQLKHNALVEAVRGYSGGSIAGKTNEVMGAHQANLDTVATREKTLISAIGQPEPAPSMLLDFASQTYFTGIRGLEQAVDPHKYLDVSRATPKWVMGPQGKLVEVPPDTLAYEYDPVTGEPEGVLIEGSRTNLALWSREIDKWALLQDAEILGTMEDKGTTFFEVYSPDTGNGSANISVDLDANAVYTLSATIKKGTANPTMVSIQGAGLDSGNQIRITWDSNGEIASAGGSGDPEHPPEYKHIGGGYYRVSRRIVANNTGGRATCYIWPASFVADGSSYGSVWISDLQLEKGEGATSPIPTSDAPVTRAADNVSRTLGDEFNKQEGTIVVRISDIEKAKGQSLFNLMEADRAAYGPRFQVGVNLDGGIGVACVDDSNTASNRGLTPMAANTTMAIAYKAGQSITFVCDGQVAVEYVNTSPTNLGELTYSDASGNRERQMNTAVLSTEFYPYALSETELQELTANG